MTRRPNPNDRPGDRPDLPQGDPNSLSDKVLDLLRGELDPAEAARVEAAVAADPALAAERTRWAALLVAARSAHEEPLDAAAGGRVAARVLDRVRREEEREAREARRAAPSSRRVLWARLLAVSVAAHVLALGVLASRAPDGSAPARDRGPLAARLDPDEGDPYAFPVPDSALAGGVDRPDDRVAMDRILEALDPVPPDPSMAGGPLEEPTLPDLREPRFAPFHPNVRRIMEIRSTDAEKQRLLRLARVDADGTMRGVRYGLDYLAKTQDARDGSFPPAAGRTAVWSTALSVLPFLGEGHGSRVGAHRDLVDRAIGWLRANAARATEPADRGVALVALAEDFMLSSGLLTPAETLKRRQEMAEIAVALARADAGSGAPDPSVSLWTSMGLAASSRVGLTVEGPSAAGSEWVALAARHPSPDAADDPRKALLEGTALLWSQAATFQEWNGTVGRALLSRIQRDGGVAVPPATSPAARAEQTALVLLGLQLSYRTY